MKHLTITSLAVVLALVMQLAPSQPNKTFLETNKIDKITTIESKVYAEATQAETIPVYCSDYLKQYGWNHSVAYNVMMVESGNKATNLNDNPNTGDYSVGCFQINLLGGNLMSKYGIMVRLGYTGAAEREQMKQWLWNPKNNVAVAWELYKGSGWGPWSFTTCKKVACY